MTILTIVNIAFWVIIGIFVLISTLIGFNRGIVKSVNRLIMLVISILLAVLTCNLIMNISGEQISNVVITQLNNSGAIKEFEELFTASPTLEQYLPTLAMHLVAPVIFLFLFILYALLTLIIGAIINIFLKGLRNKEKGVLSHVLGMITSAVGGLIISVSVLMPFAGYGLNASKVYTQLENEGLIETTEAEGANELADGLRGIKDQFVVNFVYTLSSPMFNGVTTYKNVEGKNSSVVEDVYSILGFVPEVMNLSKMDFTDVENIDLTPLKNIVSGIGDNAQIKTIVAEILSYASGKWLNNEPFMGLNIKEQLPEDLKFALDPALNKLKSTTKDTVVDDLNDFISEIETLKSVYPAVKEISKMNFSDVKSINTTPFSQIANALGNTKIVKEMVVNVMHEAGDRWLNNRAFMDINIEGMLPEDLKNCLTPAYERFINTSNETVVDDLNDFVSVLESVKAVYVDFENISKLDFTTIDSMMNIDTKYFYDLAEHASTTELGNKVLANVLSKAGEKWVVSQPFMQTNINENLPEDLKGSFNPMFELLSNSTDKTIKSDLTEFALLLDDMKVIYKDIDGFTKQKFNYVSLKSFDVSNIRSISTAVKNAKSHLTDDVTANIIAKLGENWQTSKPFMNVNIEESLTQDLKNTFTPAYDMFANTSAETVALDVDKFATLFEDVRNVLLDIDEIKKLTFNTTSDIQNMNTTAFHNLAEHANCQQLSSKVIANIMSKAGTNWANSQEYMGININEQLNNDLKDTFTPAFTLLGSSSHETVSANLEQFACLFDDMKGILGGVDGMTNQKFDADNIEKIDVTPIRTISSGVENANSTLTGEVVAKVMNKAGTKWLTPSEFMGLDIKSQLPNDYKDSLDGSLNTLKSSTKDSVGGDLNSFADSVNSLVNTYKYFKNLNNTQTAETELTKALTDSLATVTKDNKEMVANVVESAVSSGNLQTGLPTDEGSTKAVTAVITGALDKIAEQNEANKNASTGDVSQETKNDAKALDSLIEFSKSGQEPSETQAQAVVDNVLKSEAISGSVKNYANQTDSTTIAVSEEQKNAIETAITNKENSGDGTLTEEEKATLEAVKKLFGIV